MIGKSLVELFFAGRRPCPGRIHSSRPALHAAVWLVVLSMAAAGCGPGRPADAAAAPTTVTASGPDLPASAAAPAEESPSPALPTPPPPTATLPEAGPSPTPLPPYPSPTPSSTPELLSCQPAPLPGTASDVCYLENQLVLERPVQPPGRDTIDIAYRYGSTQSGTRDPHNGVEFLNSYGTPVRAVADGVVVTAENDYNKVLGLYYNFYGNLVVIEHHLAGHALPVYSLYGHLAEMQVQVGQAVQAGQQIGLVGIGGAATGSHLHFEVRFGENSYKASRNPELWLKPRLDERGQPTGALAGRILDAQGESLENENIVLERLSADGYTLLTTYILTYNEKWMRGQLPWEEAFGLGDLPAGLYRVSFVQSGMQRFMLEIRPGQLAVVTFRPQ